MSQFIISSLRGIQFASSAKIENTYERIYVHGVNYYLALWHQWKQIGLACSYLATLPPLGSGKYQIVNYTLPMGLGLGLINLAAAQYKHDYLKPQSPYLRKGLTFIAENSGKLSESAMILTSIAKFILGQRGEAVSHLAMVGFKYSGNNGILPKKVDAIFKIYLPLIAIVSGVFLGTPFLQFICTLNLINLLIPVVILGLKWKIGNSLDLFVNKNFTSMDIHYPSLKELEKDEQTSDCPAKFTSEEIENFDENTSLLIDPSHVKRSANINLNLSENIKLVDGETTLFEPLLELFDKISWEQHSSYNALERYVENDARWKDYIHSREEELLSIKKNSPEAWKRLLIDWTRTQLGLFVENISLKKKPAGDLTGFQTKQIQCLQIIEFIKNSNELSSIIREDILLTFAIAGGHYCVEAIEDTVEVNYDRLLCLNTNTNTDFRSRIDAKLYQYRKEAFSAVMMKLSDSPHVPAPFKLNDRHTNSYILQAFGQGLGLNIETMQTKQPLPVFIKWIISPFPFYRIGFWQNAYPQSSDIPLPLVDSFLKTIKENFKDVYNESVILETVEALYHQEIISRQAILEWWQSYIANKLENNESLSDLVTDSDCGVILPDNSLNQKYLKIMCIELGYLRKPDVFQKLLTLK